MTTKEALAKVRQRIGTRATWTQKAWARDTKGEPIFPTYPEAVRWCLVGAMHAEQRLDSSFPTDRLIVELWKMWPEGVGTHNDSLSHAELMAELDAILA